MMELIDWLEYFVHQANVFDRGTPDSADVDHSLDISQSSRDSVKVYIQYQENLLFEYLDRIKRQVLEWFDNIKRQNREIVRAADGTLITSQPEDMFNVIHMQLAVAKDKLPKEHIKDVINVCLQVLREVQRQAYDELAAGWDNGLDPETLCSVVNDSQRLQEKAEEFSSNVISLVPQVRQMSSPGFCLCLPSRRRSFS